MPSVRNDMQCELSFCTVQQCLTLNACYSFSRDCTVAPSVVTNDNSDTGASDSRSILWKSSRRRQSRGEVAEEDGNDDGAEEEEGAEEDEGAEEGIQAIDNNEEEESELDDQ